MVLLIKIKKSMFGGGGVGGLIIFLYRIERRNKKKIKKNFLFICLFIKKLKLIVEKENIIKKVIDWP